jgi:putative transposase
MLQGVSDGIIKIEINIPEALKAVSKFKENRLKTFEEITLDIKKSVSKIINSLLNTEMTLFLGEKDQAINKRNGYKEKDYTLKEVGTINVRVPQDRKSRFKSSIIPKNEVIDPRLKEDMAVLHLAGISTRVLAMISKRLLGINVSSTTVSSSLNLVENRALDWPIK